LPINPPNNPMSFPLYTGFQSMTDCRSFTHKKPASRFVNQTLVEALKTKLHFV
jgi:hypothetical protein